MEMFHFVWCKPKSSPYLSSLFLKIWMVCSIFLLFFSAQRTRHSIKTRWSQQVSPVQPACHTPWTLTSKKRHWKFQETKWSWDQAIRKKAAEGKISFNVNFSIILRIYTWKHLEINCDTASKLVNGFCSPCYF